MERDATEDLSIHLQGELHHGRHSQKKVQTSNTFEHIQSTFNPKDAKMQIISNNGAKLWHFGTSRCFICINFGCLGVVEGFENTRSSAQEKLENDVDTWRKTRHETTARQETSDIFRHLQTLHGNF